MSHFIRQFGLRGGGQAPVSFSPSFKPSFEQTKSVFGGGAKAVAMASFLRFDGTSTFVEWATGPATVVDGRRGTFIVPFNRKGGAGAECIVHVGSTTGESVFIGFNSSNHLVARISDGAVGPTTILEIVSTTTYTDSVNRVAIFSFDLDTIGGDAFHWLYVNDADVGGIPTTGVAADIDYTDKWRLGSTDDSSSRQWYSGATGHILFYPEVFPLPDANTRKYFYDAVKDGPVDHGADGSAALGDQPPLYWATTAAAATTNKGDGGNASSASSFSDTADPPNLAGLPGFVANAVSFDDTGSSATGDFLSYGAPLPADNALFFLKLSFRRTRTGHAEGIFNLFNSSRTYIFFDASDQLQVKFIGTGAVNRWTGKLSGVTITDTNFHTLLISADANNFTVGGKLSIRLDGSVEALDTAAGSDGTLDLNVGDWQLGREAGSSIIFGGDLAEAQIWTPSAYIDLDDSAEAVKYYSGGKPVFQGLTGMKNTGVTPAMNFRNPAAQAGLNAGTLRHATITGTLAAAASSPTD